MGHDGPAVSVVVPVYSEASNLEDLVSRVVNSMEHAGLTFEIIAVDDGSRDDSIEILKRLAAADPRLRIVSLLRNFGQTPALFAGFAHARGQVVATIDADLQDPPEELPKLIAKIGEGYDVVQGWRENRQDSVFRKTSSRALNALVSHLVGSQVHDLGCSMKVYRREVTDLMGRCTHHNRYMPAEILWQGVKMAEVKIQHSARAHGQSKYNVFNLMHLNFDMIASISTLPIKLMEMAGWLFLLLGGFLGLFVLAGWIVTGTYSPFAIILMLFLFLAGIQMVATGIMCEYVSRIYVEVQHRPYYVVKEVIE